MGGDRRERAEGLHEGSPDPLDDGNVEHESTSMLVRTTLRQGRSKGFFHFTDRRVGGGPDASVRPTVPRGADGVESYPGSSWAIHSPARCAAAVCAYQGAGGSGLPEQRD